MARLTNYIAFSWDSKNLENMTAKINWKVNQPKTRYIPNFSITQTAY